MNTLVSTPTITFISFAWCSLFRGFYAPSTEIELLSQHGVLLPGNMQGLTEEQISDLKLKDEYEDVCVPSGGCVMNPDPMGRRNGRGILPPPHTHNVLQSVCVYVQLPMTR